MKYTKVRLQGSSSIDLPIEGVLYNDIFLNKGIDGLGPPEIDVSIARTPGMGGYFQNKTPQNRQIIARIGLNPDWNVGQTPSDLRSLVYGLLVGDELTPDVTVKLFNGATEVVRTTGYVSKVEIVPFSKDPQVQVTIECMTPYWESPTTYQVPSLSTLSRSAPVINNPGDAPTGFYMKVTFVAVPLSGPRYWSLTDAAGRMMKFDAGSSNDWNTSQALWFWTQAGERNARYYATSVFPDNTALGMLTSDSTWLQLKPGNNSFTTDPTNQYFDWTEISFKPKYWGV